MGLKTSKEYETLYKESQLERYIDRQMERYIDGKIFRWKDIQVERYNIDGKMDTIYYDKGYGPRNKFINS